MTIEAIYEIFLKHPEVVTDTRLLAAGNIFFALKGPNFNGNLFAQKAIDMGASFAIIDEKDFFIEGRTILVEDVLKTLQDLAGHHRRQFSIPFLAITGSNGKTTTKELIHSVLSTSFNTYTTEGNLNNQIGIPLTLLKIKKDAALAVIEMGANHLTEIAAYCEYTRPTHGLITNCGKAHLEGFGSVEGVRKGKGELYDYLRTNGGTAFVMTDYDYLREMSHDIAQIISYGTLDASVMGIATQTEPYLSIEILRGLDADFIKTRLVGVYNLPNVLAALTIGKYFGVEDEDLVHGIENYSPSNSRSQMIYSGSNKIILDAYNANPSSMSSAIQNFGGIEADNKVLILGSMAELGPETASEHQALVNLIDQYSWKTVVLVGKAYEGIGLKYLHFTDSSEARDWFRASAVSESYLLVKGSRSMKMEKVLE
ncbi:MAG: UDP-N-acetylmuramoyl-tripeptide--D-alanyl-D-alanine ligase [Chitinophagaceae bacterium]